MDANNREYDVVIIGEEPHLAYNRVALTSYFNHRKIEELFMNPKEWVSLAAFRVLSHVLTHNPVRQHATRSTRIPSQLTRHRN